MRFHSAEPARIQNDPSGAIKFFKKEERAQLVRVGASVVTSTLTSMPAASAVMPS